ncbi:MAG: hypothetical protein EBU90_01820 [Proteobacteria bacterium]|nr:hypothetical protein [Pseudomonadota bacterium]NBP13218.1 hypothetical protein [bacterium]
MDWFYRVLEETLNAKLPGSNLQIKLGGVEVEGVCDSKVVSKVIEAYVVGVLVDQCKKYNLNYRLPRTQNEYPDFVLYTLGNESPIAIDIKTSYKATSARINGMTLGTYMGYFRNTQSTKNTVHPYGTFIEHICVCVFYKRSDSGVCIEDVVVKCKWQIASKSPGSGNTTNIGSIKDIAQIRNGPPVFSCDGEFKEYWRSFRCK